MSQGAQRPPDTGSTADNRLPTAIPGLDTVLCGVIRVGSVFIVQGPPGAGKTIFANQLSFGHAGRGGNALYITLLAESHDLLIKHMSKLDFYVKDAVPDQVYYISAFQILTEDGLPGILRLLRSESRARKASVIVLDGLFVIEEYVESERTFRKFINDVAAFANLTDCTILLLTNVRSNEAYRAEHTMVDGWIELEARDVGPRSRRELTVHKYRGSDFIGGRHTFEISNAGLTVFPRLESVVGMRAQTSDVGLVSSGVARLESLIGGGFPAASTTLIAGPTGVGKTTFGIHFLSEATPEEPGLMFSFYETPERIVRKAAQLGMNLVPLLDEGALEIIWQPATELLLDKLGEQLLDAVHRRGVRRLFVDGLGAFQQAEKDAQRLNSFLTALSNELRTLDVTAVYTEELPQFTSTRASLSVVSLSTLAENIILMRYVETQTTLARTLSVVKMRESGYDPAIQSFDIERGGIHIRGQYEPRTD